VQSPEPRGPVESKRAELLPCGIAKFTQARPQNSASMAEAEYSFSLTTFSPTGKLVQIEHALAAVGSGGTSLGLKGTNIRCPTTFLFYSFVSEEWCRSCYRKKASQSFGR